MGKMDEKQIKKLIKMLEEIKHELEQALPQSKREASTDKEPEVPYKEIVSPMVGTFFRAAAPDADPFVNEGEVVEKGQTVCIIEAMKLMNEIPMEEKGKIVKILVENTQSVEYGQVLFLYEPVV